MNTLTAQAVLQTWEHAQGMYPPRRALALLAAAWPDVDARAWGAMPIGTRDAWLFSLQESLFGPELDTRAACPTCNEALELRFATSDLRTPPADDGNAPASLRCDGYELGYRLPCSDDLIAIAEAPDASAQAAVQRLLERCVLEASYQGAAAAVADLPPLVVDRIQNEMSERDPGADASVALTCPACGHEFERRFDIGAYLWGEVDDWAHRTLADVHLLASAYGWSEAQILALSSVRRRHYLALVQA